MKKLVFILAAIVLVGLLPLTACQNDGNEKHTYAPTAELPPATSEESPDDVVFTPGGSAYRANVHQQGVENPWPPVETVVAQMESDGDTLNVRYRNNIVTEAGQTRNNILYVNKVDGSFASSGITGMKLYLPETPSGLKLFQASGGGLIGQLVAVLVIEIASDVAPGEYPLEIGLVINGKDYGTVTCTVKVIESSIEETPEVNNNYRSDNNYLSVNLPDGWVAAEGPESLVSTSHLQGQLAFNSWGEEGFWAREVRTGSSGIYGGSAMISQIPEGGAYIVLVRINMPPPISYEPEEYLLSDLSGMLTPRDWRRGSGLNSFNISKWGEGYELQIACDPAATDETVEEVNSILESWRFDEPPAGNVGWAIALARELIPDEVQPFPRYTGSFGGGDNNGTARSVDAEVSADKVVHFRFTYYWDVPSLGSFKDNLASSPQRWWNIDVLPDGKAVLIGAGGDPLPFD